MFMDKIQYTMNLYSILQFNCIYAHTHTHAHTNIMFRQGGFHYCITVTHSKDLTSSLVDVTVGIKAS